MLKLQLMHTVGVLCAATLVFVCVDWWRPALLIVGPVTIDDVNGNRTAGGAATYAAAVAKAYKTRACAVISAGPNADLTVFDDHELTVVSGNATLTFEHTYTWWGNQRKLRVLTTTGKTLSPSDVPWHCLLSRVVLLAPLIPEDVDAAAFVRLTGWARWLFSQQIGLMAQGFQRGRGRKGEVVAFRQPSSELMNGLGSGVSLFLSDVETEMWSEDTMNTVVSMSDRVVVTRGGDGASEYTKHRIKHIPVEKVEVLEDTNGAGDTFATAYMLAIANGVTNPGAEAAHAAARTVMRPQDCKPWCIGEDIHLPLSPVHRQKKSANSIFSFIFGGNTFPIFTPKAKIMEDCLKLKSEGRAA